MKKIYYLALVALVAISFSSCNFGPKQPEFQLSDLQALWHETNVTDIDHYIRFTTEASGENPYLLGLEWDEAEEITEEMMWEEREAIGHPGNGWFKYWFETNGNLHELHLMNNEGADIPKEYVVTILTDTQLSYYEKDKKNNKFTFEKVVEVKN